MGNGWLSLGPGGNKITIEKAACGRESHMPPDPVLSHSPAVLSYCGRRIVISGLSPEIGVLDSSPPGHRTQTAVGVSLFPST